MYPVSNTFKDYIKRNTVSYYWYGTIVDKDSNTYDLDDTNIVKNAGKLTRRTGTDKLAIGTTCASELEMNLYLDVDRYKLFGATITLYFRLYEGVDANQQPIYEDVPMGIYTISECNQSNGKLSLLAYDDMVKLDDVTFSVAEHTSIQTPYEWLVQICNACGIQLGNTSAQIQTMTNGTRKTGFADCVADTATWRDVLSRISAYLGGYAYIGRDGKLYIGHYTAPYIDTVSASFRSSSQLSDFRTTYNGLYAVYKNDGVQEYVSNENEEGLILDLGTNPFLQFSDDSNRHDALQAIIDEWNGVYYVPYDSSMPAMPHYDPGDVLKFVDNQADEYDYGAITEIIYNIGSQTSVTCSGDNPRLAEAQDRFTKTLAGLSSEYSSGQEIGTKNFWLIHTNVIANNNIGNSKTLVAKIEFDQKTDVQRMGFMFDCDGTLSASAVIKVEMTVDDEVVWTEEYTERRLAGKIPFPHNMGQRITGKGEHVAKVYMTVTDSALKWSELA
jgi:hypothetical protein